MEKVKKRPFSLRIALFLYMCTSLLTAQLLLTAALSAIESAMLGYMVPSPDSIVFKDGRYISFWNTSPMPSGGTEILNPAAFDALNVLRSVCPVLIYGTCVLIATYLFYRYNMKRSLAMLTTGVEKIARQELDFALTSGSRNELGQLCGAFEEMRRQLAQAFRALWQSEENQRSLYRAFAHDLRTPLSVIKGNNEIVEFVAAKNGDWQQAVEAVAVSNKAISRIETYADQLHTLDSIDELVPAMISTDLEIFVAEYRKQAAIIASGCNKQLCVSCKETGRIRIDQAILSRILDNLLINALQHSTARVWLTLTLRESRLMVCVFDDGKGFSDEAMKRATAPFYTTDKSVHMGIGLTVAQRLLTGLGSALQIANREEGGAGVSFSLTV